MPDTVPQKLEKRGKKGNDNNKAQGKIFYEQQQSNEEISGRYFMKSPFWVFVLDWCEAILGLFSIIIVIFLPNSSAHKATKL